MAGFRSFFKRKKKKKRSSSTNSQRKETPCEESRSSSVLSRTEIEELEQVFNKFDVNGDGKISSSELGSIMSNLGQQVSDEELEIMIKEVDADGDGFIDLNEFVELNTRGVNDDEILHNLKEAFSIYDIDGDGSITAQELQMVMNSLGDICSIDECKKMIGGVDADGDGAISFEEFRIMMTVGSRISGVAKSDVEAETSKIHDEDVLLMDRFVGEQEKMSKVLIFPEKKDKSTVEQGNFHLPPDFGAALACRSTEGSRKFSTSDPASLLVVDKLLMDPITVKSCIALLFADGREAALGSTENCIQTKAELQKCSFFQQGGIVEEQQKDTGHGTVSYADVLKKGIHPNETDEPGTCEAHMCNELNTD
ncbi:hypothetical protein Nepgr_003807 [Nepenthes gracilis]|uniref:EF-hand domain-containing protein n=1 Tax=Nepenthes gracilis TaxID=150966 RepID=A0AAD3S0B2_NEPGR|nr:hypothetical protein Nepgr_003807 [Nepenthes gracilis]